MKNSIVCLVFALQGFIAFGQDFSLNAPHPKITKPEASIASLMRFEEIPVSNYTGVPGVSVPVFSVPTRSKDMAMNLSLNYHPSSVAVNEPVGECGLGWSLFSGGVISRTLQNRPDELAFAGGTSDMSDIYQFNFMGHNGRFYVNKDTNGVLQVKILENANSKLEITINYNPSTYIVTSFVIYDDKGYKFYFEDYDTQTYFPASGSKSSYKGAFHLTKIYDNNGQELVGFGYNSYTEVVNISFTNIYKKTKEVLINGYGKVAYTYSTGAGTVYNDAMKISQLELKDNSGTVVKKFKLAYDYAGKLVKAEHTDATEALKETHEFAYRGNTLDGSGVLAEDLWGYASFVPTCLYSYPIENITANLSSKYITEGVLDKIKLPTGGSILFNYESNSYSYYTRDANGAWQLDSNPDNYYDDRFPENYIASTIAYNEFAGVGINTFTFTVPGTGSVAKPFYINANVTSYTGATIDPTVFVPPDPHDIYYPTLRLNGQGYTNKALYASNNWENFCQGEGLFLYPGQTYTITINAYGNNNKVGSIHLSSRENKPNPNKTMYGGGIRIKQIGYFNQDVDNGYYDTPGYYNSAGIFPVKEKNYNYNFFDQPDRSSGAIVYPTSDPDTNLRIRREPVGYKNVTVYETGNGKEQYTYTSPIDFNAPAGNGINAIYYDYKRGLLTNKKILNQSGFLQSEAIMAYGFVETPNSAIFFDNPALNERLGWAKLNQKITKIYTVNSPLAPQTVTENFVYNDDNRKVTSHTISNSLAETLKTDYTYQVGNSTLSQNRISEIESIKTYRDTELLTNSKMTYSNTWAGNVSYLLNTLQVAKGNATLENKSKYELYDEYGNPLQIRQENGLITSYIWGYNKTVPIAKLENLAYGTISGSTITNLQTLSNGTNEASLITSLNALRASYPTAMISTMTYKPLIGVSTVTDPKGDKISYDYDGLCRLKTVRDKNSNILTENEYFKRVIATDQNFIKTKDYKTATTTGISAPTVQQASQIITYYDGLGRPIQQTANAQSNSGKDIINHLEYDNLGRRIKDYLPYASTQNNMAYMDGNTLKQNIVTQYQAQYGDANPYSEKLLENSPLNRILEQAAPGNDWSLTNSVKHTIRFDYQSNAANEVKLFKAVAQWDATKGLYDIPAGLGNSSGTVFYPANELFKKIVKNENWKTSDGSNNTTEEFKDKEGRIVLTRNFENGQKHDTYSVFDQFGNLAYVIPPKADGAISQTVVDELCYQYRYDYRNRIVEKKLPGKQWEFIIYDKLDRMVASGPALSPFTDLTGYGWLIVKYDVFNRPIMTGWMPGPATSTQRKTFQTDQNNFTANFSETKAASTDTTVNGVAFRYSNVAWPTGFHALTVEYYDDYNYTNAPTVFTPIEGQTVFYNTSVKPSGLATGSWSRVLTVSTAADAGSSHILYDYKARPLRTKKTNYLGGHTQLDASMDTFSGKVNYTVKTHKRVSADSEIYVKEAYLYTAQDRLLALTHQIGTGGTPQLLAKNTYNDLGQLIGKNVGGTDIINYAGLQKVDYKYNIRGWLTGINDTGNLTQGSDPQDLFAFKINYNTVQDETNYTGTALYNGNISETYWRTSNDNVLRKYGYQYDKLNRLTNAVYQRPGNSTGPVTDSYNETVTYDKNGNIKTMVRNGDFDDPNNVLTIDNLTYFYDLSETTNRLMKVTDATNCTLGFKDDSSGANDTVNDYSYDSNGNLLSDQNKGITDIKYNHLNLPVEIIFTATKKIAYTYAANGEKVKKVTTSGSSVTTTDYLDGYQYTKTNIGTLTLQFFPHAEGYVACSKVSSVMTYDYVFNYTDHLGNIRMTYTKENNTLKILEENHYYPFGLKHTNYNVDQQAWQPCQLTGTCVTRVSRSPYQYKYNGQEFQDELGLHVTAMDFRQYDNALGRFNGIDALSELNYSTSPFAFSHNNPSYWSDPSGLNGVPAWITSIFNNSGSGAIWTNDGGGTFSTDDTHTGGGGGMVDVATGQFTGFESLQNVTIYTSVKGGYHLSSHSIGIIQSHVYWSSTFYEGFRDRQFSSQLDDLQSVFDGIGAIDPTGIVDGINALGYLARGQNANAAIAAVGIIPYIGDAAKGAKYTKSSMKLGQEMHNAYKVGQVDKINTFKEFNKVPGIRPDFVDFSTKTIYELKPFNPRAMKAGEKQLAKYKAAFESQYGGTWSTVLDTY